MSIGHFSDYTMQIFQKRAIDRNRALRSLCAGTSRSLVYLIRSVMCNATLMVSRCYAIRTTKYDSFLVNEQEALRVPM